MGNVFNSLELLYNSAYDWFVWAKWAIASPKETGGQRDLKLSLQLPNHIAWVTPAKQKHEMRRSHRDPLLLLINLPCLVAQKTSHPCGLIFWGVTLTGHVPFKTLSPPWLAQCSPSMLKTEQNFDMKSGCLGFHLVSGTLLMLHK